MSKLDPPTGLTFLGYGEAARAFSQGIRSEHAIKIASFDVKTLAASEIAQSHAKICAEDGTEVFDTASSAIEAGSLIVSTVTADQALDAAKQASDQDLAGRFYFDCNSCAPQTKQAAQVHIEEAGGRYVDVAVMAPVHPALHKTPVLISGPHAKDALDVLASLGMNPKHADGPVGTASSIKLCRSIVVKGFEAIHAEMLLAARSLGVDAQVIASLDASYPGFNFAKRGSYALDRMMVHGKRRSAEMEETATMIAGLGLQPAMSKATADWQRLIGNLNEPSGDDDLTARTDQVLKRLSPPPE